MSVTTSNPPKIIPKGQIAKEIEECVRIVPNFPKPGINFRDISTLLANPILWRWTMDTIVNHYAMLGLQPNKVAGIESRGFLLGIAIAERFRVPFLMLRKPNKLPCPVIKQDYGLEYGKDVLTVQPCDIKQDENILLVDDLLATGGSAYAAFQLIHKAGAKVIGTAFIIELDGLPGRAKLEEACIPVFAACKVPA